MLLIEKYILPYFFLFSALDSIFVFFEVSSIGGKFLMVYLFVSIIYSFSKIRMWDRFDWSVLIFILLLAFISAFKDVDSTLYYNGLRYQLVLTFFYFIGKYYRDYSQIFYKGQYVVLLMAIVGLVLFVVEPGWYVSLKIDHVENGIDINAGNNILEVMRLSGFSSYPYWISYGSFIFFIYYLKTIFNGSTNRIRHVYFCLLFLFIIMLLCLQRAPIFCSLFYFFFTLFYSSFQKNNIFKLVSVLALLSIIFLLIYANAIHYFGEDQLDFFVEKFEVFSDNSTIIEKRTSHFVLGHDISLTGEGIGLYSHAAMSQGKFAITDQQYLRILYETGIVGFIIYLLFFFVTVIKCLKRPRLYFFEMAIIVFFLISMTGANSLSMEAYHTAIFWMCCGRVFRKYYSTTGLESTKINKN